MKDKCKIKINNYQKSHILCDNQSVVNSIITQKLSNDYSIGISWIPREANAIADRISRLSIKEKEQEFNMLSLFIDLIYKQCFNKLEVNNIKDIKITELENKLIDCENKIEENKKTLEMRNTKITNQAKQINILREKLNL